MNTGRSYVVMPDGSLIPWEEYTQTPRVRGDLSELTNANEDSGIAPTSASIMKKPPMNIVIPRKTSEAFKRHLMRPHHQYGRTNNVDSINVRDFLEPTIGLLTRKKTLSDEEMIRDSNSFNIRRWK